FERLAETRDGVPFVPARLFNLFEGGLGKGARRPKVRITAGNFGATRHAHTLPPLRTAFCISAATYPSSGLTHCDSSTPQCIRAAASSYFCSTRATSACAADCTSVRWSAP